MLYILYKMSILRFLIQKNKSSSAVPEVLIEDQDFPNPTEHENPGKIRIDSVNPVLLGMSQ